MARKPKEQKLKTKLALLMKEIGVSQIDLLQIVEEMYPDNPIARPAFSRIYNGKVTNYSRFTIERICKALQVTPNDIIEHESWVEE